MAHIFISYKRNDYDFVLIMIQKLEESGFSVWIDDHIKTGEDWREAIDRAIRDAFAVIVVMTPDAKSSEYVTYEWAFALGIGVKVVPVMYKITQLHPRLDALQYLDFTKRRNRPWNRLIAHLKELEKDYDPNQIHQPQDVPPFIKQATEELKSEDIDVYRNALHTLAIANHPSATEALAVAAQQPDRERRIQAALALAKSTLFEDKRAIPGLQDALFVDDIEIRRAALSCLAAIADPSTIPSLIKVMENDEELRDAAGDALVRIGPAALDGLEKVIFSTPDEKVVRTALWAASAMGEDSVPILEKFILTSHNDWLIESALYGLGEIDGTMIARFLEHPSSGIRTIAAEILGYFAPPGAVSILTRALNDRDEWVARKAFRSLTEIGTPEALKAAEEWERRKSQERGGNS